MHSEDNAIIGVSMCLLLASNVEGTFSAVADALNGQEHNACQCTLDEMSAVMPQGTELVVLDVRNQSVSEVRSYLKEIQEHSDGESIPVIGAFAEHDTEAIDQLILEDISDCFALNEPIDIQVTRVLNAIASPEDMEAVIPPSEPAPVIDLSFNTKGQSDYPSMRILVVEDDPLLRNLLANRFEQVGFRYTFSQDGQNAVELIRQFKPDILVLDLMLPGRTGFDVLAEMQKHESMQALPVVVFSNRDNQADRHKAEEYGVKHFYVKAVTDLSELVDILSAIYKAHSKN